jgi:transposase
MIELKRKESERERYSTNCCCCGSAAMVIGELILGLGFEKGKLGMGKM